MQARSVHFLVKATGGFLKQGDAAVVVRGICTDSRRVGTDDAFLAVCGERFDGHDFIEDAAAKGCRVFVVSRGEKIVFPENAAVIVVKDTVEAYLRIAAAYRAEFPRVEVIAVCGSNGKTSTKDLTTSVLGAVAGREKVLSNARSFNNHIGVPETLLQLHENHRFAVIEVGTNHPGELKRLLDVVAPKYGILSSIGCEHLEFFKDLDGVVEEEGTIAEVLPVGGTLFLNGDVYGADRILARLKQGVNVVQIGDGKGANYSGRVLELSPSGTRFEVSRGDVGFVGMECCVQAVGSHFVTNGLLALAVGAFFGVNVTDAKIALARCSASEMRAELLRVGAFFVLKDCYNANLDSMRGALNSLVHLDCKKGCRKVAILGTMGELGASAEWAHCEVARDCAKLDIDVLVFIGKYAEKMEEVYRQSNGVGCVREYADIEDFLTNIKDTLEDGDCILVKASRAERFERVVERMGEIA